MSKDENSQKINIDGNEYLLSDLLIKERTAVNLQGGCANSTT